MERCKPILKWAGGKSQLLKELRQLRVNLHLLYAVSHLLWHVVTCDETSLAGNGVARGPDHPAHFVSGSLSTLHIGIDGGVLTPLVQVVTKSQHTRGLTRLAWSMKHEVALLAYERQYLVKIEPAKRVDAVVDVGLLRPCGVKESFHTFSV